MNSINKVNTPFQNYNTERRRIVIPFNPQWPDFDSPVRVVQKPLTPFVSQNLISPSTEMLSTSTNDVTSKKFQDEEAVRLQARSKLISNIMKQFYQNPSKVGHHSLNSPFCLSGKRTRTSETDSSDLSHSTTVRRSSYKITNAPDFTLRTKQAKTGHQHDTNSAISRINNTDNEFKTGSRSTPGNVVDCLLTSKVDESHYCQHHENSRDVDSHSNVRTIISKEAVPRAPTLQKDKIDLETNYIPPPPLMRERIIDVMDIELENSNVDENLTNDNFDSNCWLSSYKNPTTSTIRPLQYSKVLNNNDTASFRPPNFPLYLSQKLQETIKALKNSQEYKYSSDQGQGETQLRGKKSHNDSSEVQNFSFHYETKNANLDTLQATGFSLNFHHPNKTPVSTYFPGRRVSSQISSQMLSDYDLPTPSFMKQNLDVSCDEMEKNNLHSIIMQTMRNDEKSLSNLSIVPMMYMNNKSGLREFRFGCGYENRIEDDPVKSSLNIRKTSDQKNNRHEQVDTNCPASHPEPDYRFPYIRRDANKTEESVKLYPGPCTNKSSPFPSSHKLQHFRKPSEMKIAKATRSFDDMVRTNSISNVNSNSNISRLVSKNLSKANIKIHSLYKNITPPTSQPGPPGESKNPAFDKNLICYDWTTDRPPNMPPVNLLNKTESKPSKKLVRNVNAHVEQEKGVGSSSGVGRNVRTKTRKLKAPVINDPYYMNASNSEKDIIKELVRADVEAMLERDAVALIPTDEFVEELPPPVAIPAPHTTAINTKSKKEPATHWSYRAQEVKMVPTPGVKVKLAAGSGTPKPLKPVTGAASKKIKAKLNVVTLPPPKTKSKRQ